MLLLLVFVYFYPRLFLRLILLLFPYQRPTAVCLPYYFVPFMDLTSGAYLKATSLLESSIGSNPLNSLSFKRHRAHSSSISISGPASTPVVPSLLSGRYHLPSPPLFIFVFN